MGALLRPALVPMGKLKPSTTCLVRELGKCRSCGERLLLCMLWLVKVRVACLEFEQQIEINEETKRETVVEDSEKQEQG